MSTPVSVRRTFSRGNVLYSGYLFKETRTFFGRRIERKLRFFILPRVRTTDVAVKLRLAFYTQPGDAVENGCFFITPKSYIEDIPDSAGSEGFAGGSPASPGATGGVRGARGASASSFSSSADDDASADAADGATFGFRLYPTLESPPIPLWASSWEERELWKTAMTEGISLLAQKERVLRRDMRKRYRDAEQGNNHNSNHNRSSSKSAARRKRSTTEDQPTAVAHGSSGGIRGLMKFGKEILGYDQTIGGGGSDNDNGSDSAAGAPGRRLSMLRQRSFSHGDAAYSDAALSAATAELSGNSRGIRRATGDKGRIENELDDRNKSADRAATNKAHTSSARRRRSNPGVKAANSFGNRNTTHSGSSGDPYTIAAQQRQELRRRRKRSSRRLNMDAPSDNNDDTSSALQNASSTHRKRSSSKVDQSPTRSGRSYATLKTLSSSSSTTTAAHDNDNDDNDEEPQSVSSLAAEFKASILTRFSTESRGSSVGFNLNDPADRVCVAYLRTLQPVATEHQNISNILHPLLERLVLKLRNNSCPAGVLMTPEAPSSSSSSSRRKVTTISAKEARLLHEFEQTYYSSTMMIRSHRQNVMLSLRPKLRRFLMQLEREIAIADGRGRASPTSASSASSLSSPNGEGGGVPRLSAAAANGGAAANRAPRNGEVVPALDTRALGILQSGGCPAGVLHVEVLRGSKLYNTQRLVRQDPYVMLRVAGMRKPVQTQHDRSGGTEPEWTAESHGNMFALPIQGSQDVGRYPERLFVEVWNKNTLADSLIGQADIDVMPFVRNAGRTAAHWMPIASADGHEDHGRVLMRLRFENLAANRILTSDGMTQQIGSLHIGLPQAKLNLLILPHAAKGSGGAAAAEADRASSGKQQPSASTPFSSSGSSTSPASSSSSSSSSTSTSSGSSLNTSTEPTYAIRVSVEDSELLTESISVRDMEADGTLSFSSWALNRDGRQRIELPLAITNPFAKIEFVVFSVMPDTQEERVLGSADTSLLHLVEQQTTASMEHEKLEELRWKRIDSSIASSAAATTAAAAAGSSKASTRKAMLKQESVEDSKYTAFQKSFQQQLANARGRGQEGLRTASALLRGPAMAKTNLSGNNSSAQSSSSGGGGGGIASAPSGRPVMLPPCVLKLKSRGRKEDKEVGVLQLQLHYEEKPRAVFIPRKVKLENHDFSFRRFEMNVSRSIRMVQSIRAIFALGSSIMRWEEPLITAALLCLFIWTCLFAFERQIASVPIALVIILLRQHKHRKSGRFRHDFVLRGLTGKISAAIGASASAASSSLMPAGGEPKRASSTVGDGMPTELRVAVIAAKNLPGPATGASSFSMPSRSVSGPARSAVSEFSEAKSKQSGGNKPSAFAEVYFVAVTRKSARRREARKIRRGIREQRAAATTSRGGGHSRGESYSTEALRSSAQSFVEGGYRTSRSPRPPTTSVRESAELSFGGFLSPDDAVELDRRIEAKAGPIRKVKLIESSSLVGRTNTEYENDAPRWGINEKSLGASRLHIPGERTVVERWHDHATAFKAILPQTSGRDLFGIGIGSGRRVHKVFSDRHPTAVAEAMATVEASAASGSFEWDNECGKSLDFDGTGEDESGTAGRHGRLSSFSGESVVVIRVYHEGKDSASSGGINLEDRNDCQCLGQAIVPLSDLVGANGGVQGGDQPVVEKWIDLVREPSQDPAASSSRMRHAASSSSSSARLDGGKNGDTPTPDEAKCQVLVRLQLALPLPTWHTRRMLQQRIVERHALKDRRRALRMERRQQRQSVEQERWRSMSPTVMRSGVDHPRDGGLGAAAGSDASYPQRFTPQRGHAQSSPLHREDRIGSELSHTGVDTPVRLSGGGLLPFEPSTTDQDSVSDLAAARTSSNRASSAAAAQATPKGKLVGHGGAYSLGTGYYGRFLKIRSSTKYVQNGLDNIARTFERVKNLLNWAHPSKTHAVLVVMLVLSVLFLIIPTRFIILVTGIYLFTEKFRRQGTIVARSWHFINTIPSDEQLDGLFEDERSRFQERLQRGMNLKKAKRRLSKTAGAQGSDLVSKPSAELDLKGAKVDLHANWEGYMQTYGRSRIGKTIKKRNTRYFALQSHGVLQWWLRRELAEAGQKPRGELFLSPADARSVAGDRGASMVLPVDRNNEWELELRGFRDRALTVRLVIVLIARSSNDREGWLHAIQQVIEQMEIQSELKTVEAMQEQAEKEAERQMKKHLERQRARRLKTRAR